MKVTVHKRHRRNAPRIVTLQLTEAEAQHVFALANWNVTVVNKTPDASATARQINRPAAKAFLGAVFYALRPLFEP